MASTAAIESPRRDNNYFSTNNMNNNSNEDEGSTNNMAVNYQEEDDFPLIDEEDEDYFDTQYFHQSSTQSSTSQQQKQISNNSSSEEQSNEDAWVQLLNLPPNLTSQNLAPVGGMRRVSSCYFSIASNMSNDSPNNNNNNNTMRRVFSSTSLASQFGYDALSFDGRNPTDFLLHDILMNVFTFLDARSLASFSETGRRCNFECFYFMELQLQRALLMGSSHVGDYNNERDKGDKVDIQVDNETDQNDAEENVDDIGLLLQDDEEVNNNDATAADDEIPTTSRKRSNAVPTFEGSISGTGVISRLASLDSASARKIVQTYLDSNTSIHALPLSHSLAYFRQLLARQSQNLPIPSFPLRGRGEGGAATTTSALTLPSATNISENMAKNARNMALFFTFIGAAYMRTHQGGVDMPIPPITMPDPSEVLTEENMEALKNMMGFGFVGGAMLKAGKTMKDKADQANASASDSDDDNGGGNQQQENIVEDADVAAGISRQPQQGRSSSIGSLEDLSNMLHHPSKIASRLYNAFSSNSSLDTTGSTTVEESHSSSSTKRRHRSKRSHRTIRHSDIDEGDELDDVGETSCSKEKPPSSSEDENNTSSPLFKGFLSPEEIAYNLEHFSSPDPYEHPSSSTLNTMGKNGSNSNMDEEETAAAVTAASAATSSFFSAFSKQESIDEGNVPSGCIGAYTRAVKAAASEVTRLVKEERKRNFETLDPDEQLELGVRFIDACTSDSKIDIVKDILQKQKMMDVDRFFVGPDDTETCALHAAAFNGAEKVLEFLCGGIDEHDGDEDCGLCDVNVTDANGWTALHFASGANSVTSVKVLAKHGAKLTIEASNGYTPYHWAERLSNEEVRTALAELGADNRFVTGGWMLSSPGQDDVRRIPFVSFMANRFFGHHTN